MATNSVAGSSGNGSAVNIQLIFGSTPLSSGDIITIGKSKEGNYQVEGDARVVNAFSKRLKQIYAYESIKENLPLDFEIVQEKEVAGEMKIVLKG